MKRRSIYGLCAALPVMVVACGDGGDDEIVESGRDHNPVMPIYDAAMNGAYPGAPYDAGFGDAGGSGPVHASDAAVVTGPLAKPPAVSPSVRLAPPMRFGAYSFSVPPGATGVPSGTAFEIYPASAGQTKCVVDLFPLAPTQLDLEAQASQLVLNGLGIAGSLRVANLGMNDVRGRSPYGWTYVTFDREVLDKSGGRTEITTRMMMIRLGALVAPVLAVFGGGNCLDQGPLLWPYLIYSLRFPDYETADDGSYARALVGAWTSGGGGSLGLDVFDARGRYAAGTSSTGTRPISSTQEIESITSTNGTGRYWISGNQLTQVPDTGIAPSNVLIRIEQEALPGSAQWNDVLRRFVSIEGIIAEKMHTRSR